MPGLMTCDDPPTSSSPKWPSLIVFQVDCKVSFKDEEGIGLKCTWILFCHAWLVYESSNGLWKSFEFLENLKENGLLPTHGQLLLHPKFLSKFFEIFNTAINSCGFHEVTSVLPAGLVFTFTPRKYTSCIYTYLRVNTARPSRKYA